MEILEGCSKILASSVSSKDVDTQQKPSTFALYVDRKLKLLDNRTHIITETRISDILFEAEMGYMPSSIPNNYNHPHLRSTNTEITTQPNYWRSMVTSESQRVLNETLFCLKHFYILTNMFNSLLTDDILTFYIMNSFAANCS